MVSIEIILLGNGLGENLVVGGNSVYLHFGLLLFRCYLCVDTNTKPLLSFYFLLLS